MDKAKREQILGAMVQVMRTWGAFLTRLLIEGWDFVSDAYVLVDVLKKKIVEDLIVAWLVCTFHVSASTKACA